MGDFNCPQCKNTIPSQEFKGLLWVCSKCNYHSRIGWQDRLSITVDEGSFIEFDSDMESLNPISFPGYEEKVFDAQKNSQSREAVITGTALIGGYKTGLCIMDSRFMMASIGSVVGEKITRTIEYSTNNKLPLVIFCASGGARMQEGIFSLMQMAKTSGAVGRHDKAGGLYISVLCDPTTGGLSASYAMLGDIIIAEPGITVGFAGKRVIQDTIGAVLPENFQTSEFGVEHGFIDLISERKDLPSVLEKLFRLHGYKPVGENLHAA